MSLTQIEQAKELLSIEYVSVVGLLLIFCYYLIWVNKQTKQELKDARKENKEKDEMIAGFMEKYYTIASKLYDFLK